MDGAAVVGRVASRWKGGLSLLLAALLMAACGNRLSSDEILAANTVDLERGAQPTEGIGPSQEAAGDSSDVAVPVGDGDTGTATTAPSATATTRVGDTNGADERGPSVVANGEPIKIGFIGDQSGIGATVHIPKRDALKVWEQKVNAAGGINGHPVEVLVGDNASNEAQAAAIARDFIDNKGVIALTVGGPTESSAVAYAEKQGVPVIGVAAGAGDGPMMFKTSPANESFNSAWALLAKNAGVKRVATLFCAESGACNENSQAFARAARQLGLDVVYQGRISVTQPDFTAECLQARGEDAELIVAIGDNTAPVRMAQSCGRQNYLPIWMIVSSEDSQASVPELDGAIAPLDAFPWTLRSGAPGIEEFVAAFETYLPSRLANGSRDLVSGWVAAKTIEKAAMAIAPDATPSSELLLEGLWAMENETLDGLARGGLRLTFTKGEPARDIPCALNVVVKNGEWVPELGLDPLCL